MTKSLQDTLAEIKALSEWKSEDWKPISWNTLFDAALWVQELYWEVKEAEMPWLAPCVMANAEGEVVFQWERGVKTLTVYVDKKGPSFGLASWGPDMVSEMAEKEVSSPSGRREAWEWLNG